MGIAAIKVHLRPNNLFDNPGVYFVADVKMGKRFLR